MSDENHDCVEQRTETKNRNIDMQKIELELFVQNMLRVSYESSEYIGINTTRLSA